MDEDDLSEEEEDEEEQEEVRLVSSLKQPATACI